MSSQTGGDVKTETSPSGDLSPGSSTTPTTSDAPVPPPSYDEEYYQRNLDKVVKVQAVAKCRTLRHHYQILVKLHRKRTCVAREIWHSETTYLEGLMVMLQLFKKPLQQKAASEATLILTTVQIECLFSNIEQLIDASKRLVKELQDVILKWTPSTRVGHIFINNAEMLKDAYTPYVDNFDIANALFVKLKQENKKFVDFLATVEYKACDLGLESYLIMPIQRVARYGLLLREFIKQTWQDHDDYQDLLRALKAVDAVAQHVNEHKTKLIHLEKIRTIQSQVQLLPASLGDLTANNRQYILEGAVTEIGKMPITHYLFLFNDLLIWTQQINKKKFMYRRHNFLSRLTAVAGELNSVRIITDEGETKIFTKSKEEQNKWITYLENEDYTPPTEEPQPKRPTGPVYLSLRKMVQSRLEVIYSKQNRNSMQGKKERSSQADEKEKSKKDKPVSKTSDSYHRKARTIDAKMMEQHKQLKAQMAQKQNPNLVAELKHYAKHDFQGIIGGSADGVERRQTVQLPSDASESRHSKRSKDVRLSEQLPPRSDAAFESPKRSVSRAKSSADDKDKDKERDKDRERDKDKDKDKEKEKEKRKDGQTKDKDKTKSKSSDKSKHSSYKRDKTSRSKTLTPEMLQSTDLAALKAEVSSTKSDSPRNKQGESSDSPAQ